MALLHAGLTRKITTRATTTFTAGEYVGAVSSAATKVGVRAAVAAPECKYTGGDRLNGQL